LSSTDYESQFRRVLEEHSGLLFKVVRSFTVGPSDSDDLLQEILLQVWMSLPSFRAQSKTTTWLYRVALNTALAWKRRETKHRDRSRAMPLAFEIVDEGASSAELQAERESIQQMYEAVRALAPADRALVLLYLDGLSYADMADVIGISESNVGVRLNRIKKSLAARVNEAQNVAG
jgi:RNA polymerase sigma-70 factor (ECF subfamily)